MGSFSAGPCAVRWVFIGLLLFGVASSGTAASGECDFSADALVPPSGPDGGAMPLEVGVFLLDLIKIDDVAQGYVADLFVKAVWQDPQLAGVASGPCFVPLNRIWTPRVEILNQRDLTAKWEERIRLLPDGTAIYRQRYYGMLSFRADLTEFPFDRQVIPIQIVVGEADEQLEVITDPVTGRSESMSIPNWSVGKVSSRVDLFSVATTSIELPLFVAEFPVQRRTSYYVFKIIVPLVLIVIMSWAVFWIHPRHIPPRLGLAATGMLTLIAFQLALSAMLPPVAYITRLDKFVIGGTILVFAALAEAVTTAALADSGRVARAERVNTLSRLVFPVGLAACVLVVLI